MTLQSSGKISHSDIKAEFEIPAGSSFRLSADGGPLISYPSGNPKVKESDFYGAAKDEPGVSGNKDCNINSTWGGDGKNRDDLWDKGLGYQVYSWATPNNTHPGPVNGGPGGSQTVNGLLYKGATCSYGGTCSLTRSGTNTVAGSGTTYNICLNNIFPVGDYDMTYKFGSWLPWQSGAQTLAKLANATWSSGIGTSTNRGWPDFGASPVNFIPMGNTERLFSASANVSNRINLQDHRGPVSEVDWDGQHATWNIFESIVPYRVTSQPTKRSAYPAIAGPRGENAVGTDPLGRYLVNGGCIQMVGNPSPSSGARATDVGVRWYWAEWKAI
jgi:hypothetical protein